MFIRLISPDKKVTVNKGLTLRTGRKKSRKICIHRPTHLYLSRAATFSYLKAEHCHRSLCHSLCCLPPGNWGSSTTCSRSHQTHVTARERACVHGSPSRSPDHLLYRTTPAGELCIKLEQMTKCCVMFILYLSSWH